MCLADVDYLCADLFKKIVLIIIAGESGPHVLLLKFIPWGSYCWYVGELALAFFISLMGVGSLGVGRSASF